MADLHSSIIEHLARIEEKEKNRGYQHGLVLGKQTVLCEHLQHRFGAIPDGVIAEVMSTIEPGRLDALLHAAKHITQLTEVFDPVYSRPPPEAKDDPLSQAMERFCGNSHLGTLRSAWPPLTLNETRYHLIPLTASQCTQFQPAVIKVGITDPQYSALDFNSGNAVFDSAPLCHLLLHRLAGESCSFDEYKSSFSYRFLLHFLHGNQAVFYILHLFNWRSVPTIELFKLVRDRDLTQHRNSIASPFPDLPDSSIHSLRTGMKNLIYSLFHVMQDRLTTLPLFATIPSQLQAYGCFKGRIYYRQFDDEDAFTDYRKNWRSREEDWHPKDTPSVPYQKESVELTMSRSRGYTEGRQHAAAIMQSL